MPEGGGKESYDIVHHFFSAMECVLKDWTLAFVACVLRKPLPGSHYGSKKLWGKGLLSFPIRLS